MIRSEIKRTFPTQIDGFERLIERILDYDDLDGELGNTSARQIVGA